MPGLHIAVLEGIVEQYHIHILGLFVDLQSLYSSDSFGIYCHIDVRELLVHLEGLIANLWHLVVSSVPVHSRCFCACIHVRVRQSSSCRASKRMRYSTCGSLTRPAYRDVAYGYDGQAESLASLDAYIEEPVAKADCHTV